MGFSSTASGTSAIFGSSDVALNNPVTGQVLVYNAATQKWSNTNGSSSFTAIVSTVTNGTITLTAGTSPQLTKLKATLTSNITVALAGTISNTIFELSLIETVFGNFTVSVGSDVFSYPTIVKYVYIGTAWERTQ